MATEEKCENCGSLIGKLQTACVFNNNIVCSKCDAVLRNENVAIATVSSTVNVIPSQTIKCPNCGSTHIDIDKKGFSAGKSIGFALLLGPIGALSGFHGSKRVQVSCINCGNSWVPAEQR